MGALVIGVFFMIIGGIVSFRLKSKFKRYSQTPLAKNLTQGSQAPVLLKLKR